MNEELIELLMKNGNISREQAINIISEQNKIASGTLDGKNAIGYRAPLDGSTMPKDQQAGTALFPNRYGDVNYFAENWNKVKTAMEESFAENPFFVDGENGLTLRSTNPDNLSGGGAVSMRESRQQARVLNKNNVRDNLGYQKIQGDAFYKPTSQAVAKFEEGGVYGTPNTVPNLFGTGLNLNVDQLLSGTGNYVPPYLANNPQYLSNLIQNSGVLNRNQSPTTVPTQIVDNTIDSGLVNQNGGLNWSEMSGINTEYDLSSTNYNNPVNNNSPVLDGDAMTDEERAAIDANKQLWKDSERDANMQELFNQMSMFNPYGTDIETELYTLGRSIGNAQNGNGGAMNAIQGIAAGGAALFGGTRSALSGYSTEMANNRYREWMEKRRNRQVYSPNSQTINSQADGVGGVTQG